MDNEDISVSRVTEMEGYLRECTEAFRDMDLQLDRMEELAERASALFAYYGSSEWYDDLHAELPEGTGAGVLSEDLVYDQITAVREEAFRMLELSADILRNWI